MSSEGRHLRVVDKKVPAPSGMFANRTFLYFWDLLPHLTTPKTLGTGNRAAQSWDPLTAKEAVHAQISNLPEGRARA